MTASIAPGNSRSVIDAIAFIVVITLLAGVFGLIGWLRHLPGVIVLYGAIFVVSLFVGIPIMRRDRALRRFHPGLVLDTTPVPIGGKLTGHVQFAADGDTLRSVNAIRVKLLCLRRLPNASLSRKAWSEVKEFPPSALRPISGGLALPVAFDIPPDVKATGDLSPWGYTVWRVDVQADIRGGAFNAQFEVPVARSEEAAPQRMAS